MWSEFDSRLPDTKTKQSWYYQDCFVYQYQDIIETTKPFFFFSFGYVVPSFLLLLLPLHYFTRFWHFALWGLPLTLGAIIYINLTYDSGLFGFGAGFDLLLVGTCYVFFFLGAMVQLVIAWWSGK